jgi:transcription factor C subunit 3
MIIIKARCRSSYRVEWEACRQVFPALNRNSFRNRIPKLLAGREGYAECLENTWRALWEKHRGTTELSDPHPTDLQDFDLAEHITFLRRHIDKDNLYVFLVSIR